MRLYLETLKKIESEFGDFDISQIIGGSKDVYIRFGYWKQIDTQKLQQIIGDAVHVVEDTDYDDDCGNQFMYRIQNPF